MTTKEIEWGAVQGPMSWDAAKELELGGWRLPTVPELTALFDYDKGESREQAMAGKDFWSSSSYAANTSYAWYVNFINGYVNYYNKYSSYFVRLVRGVTT